MDGVQLLQGYREGYQKPVYEDILLFTTKFPQIPGTNLINLGRMKGWVNLGTTEWFWTHDPELGIQYLNHYAITFWRYDEKQLLATLLML